MSFDVRLEHDPTITNQFMKLTCSSKAHDCHGCSSPTSRSISRGGFSESVDRSSVPNRSFKQIDSRLLLNDPSLLSSMICGIIPMAAKMGAIFYFLIRNDGEDRDEETKIPAIRKNDFKNEISNTHVDSGDDWRRFPIIMTIPIKRTYQSRLPHLETPVFANRVFTIFFLGCHLRGQLVTASNCV